ncbi:MAG: ribosome silencing factor [Bacteroidales bacterium]
MEDNKLIVEKIVEGIQQKKGRSITHIDLSSIESASAQDFVICTGTSNTHVAAIADSVREYLRDEISVKPYNYDGYQNAQWIVIDYGTVYVHIFLDEYREYYNLEQLWNDAVINDIPDLD